MTPIRPSALSIAPSAVPSPMAEARAAFFRSVTNAPPPATAAVQTSSPAAVPAPALRPEPIAPEANALRRPGALLDIKV